MPNSPAGLLGILNAIGGRLLSLHIGDGAWKNTNSLQMTRPISGGAGIGLIAGVLLALLWTWMMLLIVPLVFAYGGALLHLFKTEMEI